MVLTVSFSVSAPNPLQQVAKTTTKTNVSFTEVSMSGANKAVDLHLQMRHNTEDLVNFMKDLETWETDIKKKDEELRTGRVQEGQVGFFCHGPSCSVCSG